jgi:hypothetical protein
MVGDMSKVTKNKNGKPRKTGSGRTKGATSLVKVSLGTLKKYLASDSIVIPVGRVWLRVMGIEVVAAKAKKIKEEEDSQKVEYSLTTFEN